MTAEDDPNLAVDGAAIVRQWLLRPLLALFPPSWQQTAPSAPFKRALKVLLAAIGVLLWLYVSSLALGLLLWSWFAVPTDSFWLLVATLPFGIGLLLGYAGYRVPISELVLLPIGSLLFASAAVALFGLVMWGPPGVLVYGVGLGKAFRIRLLPFARLKAASIRA